jgi:hypothetical protein
MGTTCAAQCTLLAQIEFADASSTSRCSDSDHDLCAKAQGVVDRGTQKACNEESIGFSNHPKTLQKKCEYVNNKIKTFLGSASTRNESGTYKVSLTLTLGGILTLPSPGMLTDCHPVSPALITAFMPKSTAEKPTMHVLKYCVAIPGMKPEKCLYPAQIMPHISSELLTHSSSTRRR